MSSRKKEIRKWANKGRWMLLARSDIGSIEIDGDTYHEAHLVCYSDGSGRITLRSKLQQLHKPEPATGYFFKGFSLSGLDEHMMLEYVESLFNTLKKGEIPQTHQRGCHYSPPEKIRFEKSVWGGVLV